jgi:hypothetical protein
MFEIYARVCKSYNNIKTMSENVVVPDLLLQQIDVKFLETLNSRPFVCKEDIEKYLELSHVPVDVKINFPDRSVIYVPCSDEFTEIKKTAIYKYDSKTYTTKQVASNRRGISFKIESADFENAEVLNLEISKKLEAVIECVRATIGEYVWSISATSDSGPLTVLVKPSQLIKHLEYGYVMINIVYLSLF